MPARLFDTHCHLFEFGYTPLGDPALAGQGAELAAYQQFRTDYRIERSLVVAYDDGEFAGNSDYVAALAAQHDWIVPTRFVDAEQYASPGSALPRTMSAYPTDAALAERLTARLLAETPARAPRIMSLNAPPEALAHLAPAIDHLDRTWFLISHLGLPGPMATAAEAEQRLAPLWQLSGRSNVSIKISGQYAATRQPYPHTDVAVIVDMLADRMGIDSLVWGSDFSPTLTAGPLEQAVNCQLPSGAGPAEQDAIYFANAHRMLRQFCEEPQQR